MISIIICSRTSDVSLELQQNIAGTIGCDYEIVVIDNSRNEFDIFRAYNVGISRTNGDVLCFIHDDIRFHSSGWGENVQQILSDKAIGLLGVFGSHFMPKAPLYWWSSPYISQYSINTDNGVQSLQEHLDFYRDNIAEVAVVDGVCMFMRADLFPELHFDEERYSGFHAYDMDLSMQVQKMGLKVCVTKDVLLEHFWSEASMNIEQYAAMLDKNMNVFASKWADLLPIVRGVDLPDDALQRLDNLCKDAYESQRLQRSKAYRLGKFLLHPSRDTLRKLMKRHK